MKSNYLSLWKQLWHIILDLDEWLTLQGFTERSGRDAKAWSARFATTSRLHDKNITIGRSLLCPIMVDSFPDADPYTIPSFVYEPVRRPDVSIRLLEVYPDEENGPIRVRLWEDRAPGVDQYRCLSYMWGAPSGDRFEIVLNNCVFHVRENLYHFLRTAGQRFPGTPLWIDAISINQADHVEKGKQVSRMADIYFEAAETIIWLGNDAQVGSALEWVASGSWDWSSNAAFASLERLYADPYWNRMICQEILVSRKLKVHNTQAQVEWTQLGAAVKKRPKKGQEVLDIWQGSNPEYFWNLWNDRLSSGNLQNRQHPERHSIWSLLITLFTSGCADQRDRIYGLLALVEDGRGFEVNYTETPVALFWRAGERFGAWARPAFVSALRQALGVTLPELKDSLAQHADLDITIPVRLFTSRSPFSSKAKCAHKECRKQRNPPPTSRPDMSLCARIDAQECQDIQCVHVLVHPVPKTRQSFEITFIAPAHNRYPGLTKNLDSIALQHYISGAWRGVENWSYIEQRIKRNGLEGHWRLQLSPVLIVEHLTIMSESSALTYDEVE